MLMVHSGMAAMTGAGFGGEPTQIVFEGVNSQTRTFNWTVPPSVAVIHFAIVGQGSPDAYANFDVIRSGAGGALIYSRPAGQPVVSGETISVSIHVSATVISGSISGQIAVAGAGSGTDGGAVINAGLHIGRAGDPGQYEYEFFRNYAVVGGFPGRYIGQNWAPAPAEGQSLIGLSGMPAMTRRFGRGASAGWDINGNPAPFWPWPAQPGGARIAWGTDQSYPNNAGDR